MGTKTSAVSERQCPNAQSQLREEGMLFTSSVWGSLIGLCRALTSTTSNISQMNCTPGLIAHLHWTSLMLPRLNGSQIPASKLGAQPFPAECHSGILMLAVLEWDFVQLQNMSATCDLKKNDLDTATKEGQDSCYSWHQSVPVLLTRPPAEPMSHQNTKKWEWEQARRLWLGNTNNNKNPPRCSPPE